MNTDLTRPMVGVTYSSKELSYFSLWHRMFTGIVVAGGTPVAIDCTLPVPHITELVDHLDGLVLGGGGDVSPALYGADAADPALRGVNEARDQAEIAAFEQARDAGLPLLAICRGAQLVNAHLGGSLFVDLIRDKGTDVPHRHTVEALAGPLHEVSIAARMTLAAWLEVSGTIAVNSQHHQGIRSLAPGLRGCAYAPDGLVEAFEVPGTPVVGVQWHPEVLWPTHPHAQNLLTNFVRQCALNRSSVLAGQLGQPGPRCAPGLCGPPSQRPHRPGHAGRWR